MKTLDDFLKDHHFNTMKTLDMIVCIDAPRVYEGERLRKAVEDYAAYMCQQQREICAEAATCSNKGHDDINGHCIAYEVDKESILKSPLATDKNK